MEISTAQGSNRTILVVCADFTVLFPITDPLCDGGAAVLRYIAEVMSEGLDKPGSWTEIISSCKSMSYHVTLISRILSKLDWI